MPRKKQTDQDLALQEQFKNFVQQIKGADEPKVDVARAISLFESAQKNIIKALAVLRGETLTEELEPGKNRVGRPRKPVVEQEAKAPAEPRQRVGGKFVKKQTEPVAAEVAVEA